MFNLFKGAFGSLNELGVFSSLTCKRCIDSIRNRKKDKEIDPSEYIFELNLDDDEYYPASKSCLNVITSNENVTKRCSNPSDESDVISIHTDDENAFNLNF